MKKIKNKILFIINPISGVGKQKRVEKALEDILDKEKFDYSIAYTEYAHHGTAISLKAVMEGYDTVVAVGGDGSINDCVKGLVGSKVTLGIIPAGSGNGLARHLNIPLNVEDAIRLLNNSKKITIDTIKLNNTVYASIAGIGFDALIAREFKKSKVRGFNTYFRLVMQHYALYEPKKYVLEVDGERIETNALFICFANSNQFGYNTTIAPNAKLDDGLIDVSIVKKVPLVMIPWTIQLMFFRNFDKSIYVNTFKAKNIRVLKNPTHLINLDGESVVIKEALNLSIDPQSLNVLISNNDGKERKEPNWGSIFNQPFLPLRD